MPAGRRIGVWSLAAVVVALAVSAAAWADNYTYRLNAADQAVARATVLRRGDLGKAPWKGGPVKPDTSAVTCANYHPKLADLVVTGDAESDFKDGDVLVFDSQVSILQTAQMVRLDWHRSIETPGALSCLRSHVASAVGGRLISAQRLAFPHVATFTAAFRVVFDVITSGETIRYFVDAVALAKDRTEITLTTTAPFGARGPVDAAEVRLARLLASRIHE